MSLLMNEDSDEDESNNANNENNSNNNIEDQNSQPRLSSEQLLSQLSPYPDGDTFRILLVTDTHLGYQENNEIRCYDSFNAFDEALSIANKYNCDMVLHSGDLYHQNRPSRFTRVKATNILRKHCLGNKPIHFQIISDQSKNFVVNKRVNYEDPNFNISLPMFIIHGNHDDPAGKGQYAALEELASANLVNYFGRQDDLDKIEMFPILMKKGETRIALYGLGYIRDERLHRAFLHHKVKWIRPKRRLKKQKSSQNTHVSMESQDINKNEDWFNIMMIHQNRTQHSINYKNCIPEEFLPKFLDLVYWGHEHESIIDLNESLSGHYWITQPGSPIATSLSQSETKDKCVGIVEIRNDECRLIPVKLQTTRPFIFDDVVLSDFFESDALDDDIEQFLIDRIRGLIISNDSGQKNDNNDNKNKIAIKAEKSQKNSQKNCQKNSQKKEKEENDENKNDNSGSNVIDTSKLPLVRMRVEYSGFRKLRTSQFGQHFMKQVANPDEILLFYKKKSIKNKNNDGNNDNNDINMENDSDLRADYFGFNLEDIEQATPIQDIVTNNLSNTNDPLTVIAESDLMEAVESFVDKESIRDIEEFCNKKIDEIQKKLIESSDINIDNIENECKKITQARRGEINRAKQLKIIQKQQELKDKKERLGVNSSQKKKKENNNNEKNNENDNEIEEESDDDLDLTGIVVTPNAHAANKNVKAKPKQKLNRGSVVSGMSDDSKSNDKNIGKGKAKASIKNKRRAMHSAFESEFAVSQQSQLESSINMDINNNNNNDENENDNEQAAKKKRKLEQKKKEQESDVFHQLIGGSSDNDDLLLIDSDNENDNNKGNNNNDKDKNDSVSSNNRRQLRQRQAKGAGSRRAANWGGLRSK